MNPVQQKISCVYVSGVLNEPSSKRHHQTFRVAATRELKSCAVTDGVSSAKATEKLDGTCCLIAEFQGQPWLWARHDRKPSKVGERRFAHHKRSKAKIIVEEEQSNKKDTSSFEWNPAKDFKEVPEHWMPALGLEVKNDIAMPDDIGHTPGWVPIQKHVRQHCWHQEAVDFGSGNALVLRQSYDFEIDCLVIESIPLSSLLGQTCELIGTNINGNPYGLGCKKNPFHVLVPHGGISLTCPDPTDYDNMLEWMTSEIMANQVEGVVWHCTNGQLYKLHRHHLQLQWPDKEPSLCQRQVLVRVEFMEHDQEELENNTNDDNMFKKLSPLNGQCFNSLIDMCASLASD